MLRESGYSAYVIVGGLKAWTNAGYEVERVPQHEVVLLPTFS